MMETPGNNANQRFWHTGLFHSPKCLARKDTQPFVVPIIVEKALPREDGQNAENEMTLSGIVFTCTTA
jgi:hypothetical protein